MGDRVVGPACGELLDDGDTSSFEVYIVLEDLLACGSRREQLKDLVTPIARMGHSPCVAPQVSYRAGPGDS